MLSCVTKNIYKPRVKECTFDLSESLKGIIGVCGSLVTWNMGFERSCNTTMGSYHLNIKISTKNLIVEL